MRSTYDFALTAGIPTLVLVSLSTLPALVRLFNRLRQKPSGAPEGEDRRYKDEDGIATPESQQIFAVAIPKQVLLATTVAGCCVSIVAAVQSPFHFRNGRNMRLASDWFTIPAWTLILVQAVNIHIERSPPNRFREALVAALASAILFVFLLFEVDCCEFQPGQTPNGRLVHLILVALQLVCAAISFVTCLLLPRRPSVSSGGYVVDKQFTVSALSRSTYSWADELLTFAKKNNGLDLIHLPQLHFKVRSRTLEQNFVSFSQKEKLWKKMMRVHWVELCAQSFLAVVQGLVQFAPQFAMYKLLELLEHRTNGEAVDVTAWGWVFGLGLSIIVTAWIEAFLHWVVWARLGLLVRSELSALIFSKSTRRKDVKGSQKAESAGRIEENSATEPTPNVLTGQTPTEPNVPAPGSVKGNPEEEVQKSRQSVINLIGIDTKRVADFATFHYIFSQSIAKLFASIFFLVKLIGWPSLLAGFAVSAIALPFNIWASRVFSRAQDELMKSRDQKMVVVTEALQGIRQIKFSALEQQWQDKIGKKRGEELAAQMKVFFADTALIALWILGPVMLSAVSLAVFAVLHGDLTPSIAFTTITIFAQIEATLSIIPELTSDGLEAWVSLKRIGEYLDAPEKQKFAVDSDEIAFEDASVAWPSDTEQEDSDRFILRNINVQFPSHKLSVISGMTGSGKSLLLAAILGEVDKLGGTVKIPVVEKKRFNHRANKGNWIINSAIAFVAQIPWIENASIKDNILFGLPFNEDRYLKVISSCALRKDLDMLPDGELTDIGANGINLSGGQRWRVTFARALYSRAGILILDDIFSAVDAHVGRQLFEEALTGELGKGRTRILVTHHVGLTLPRTDYAVSLSGGTVEHAGFVEDLQRTGVLDQILRQEADDRDAETKKVEKELSKAEDEEVLHRILTTATESSALIDTSGIDSKAKSQPKKFTEEEKREKGSIKLGIWGEYLKTSGGWWFWPPVMLFFIFYQVVVLGRSWWISLWTRSYETEAVLIQQIPYQLYGLHPTNRPPQQAQAQANRELSFYLTVYVGISILICITGTWRYFCVFVGSLRASRKVFEKLTYAVLRAPLRWLDTVPVGRILNRFTADFAVVDSKMGNDVAFMIYQVIQLTGIIIAGLFVSPYMLLCAAGLLSICVFVALRFLAGAREVKRLESNAKSPIFEQFGSSLAGIGTIRAFDKVDAYIDRMFEKIDAHTRAFWYIWLFNRWMAFRLNAVGAIFSILVATVIVSTKGIDASLAGFALSFALQYSSAIMWTIRQYTSVELAMNAMERIVEYSRIPTEDQEGSLVPAAWPTEGQLEIDNLVVGYASDLPPVLKGLSFSVSKNQRVGVVGRTGAGKSSLTLAIFRFLEAREGRIVIDGIDISKVRLNDLRNRLAIIPQDPVLFSGTVRSNLDAFDERSDAELYDALERVHLIRGTGNVSRGEPASVDGSDPPSSLTIADTNTNIFSSLSSRISEGGLNLSQGQRQLLCLARAIVSRPKIMVLDEATSAVDMATDVLIQRSIREEFEDSTLIVIAHRLSTIADFDFILVMSDGKAIEYDTPRNLLARQGVFWEMVEQSGERDRLEQIILGVDLGQGEGRA